jgi:hypothetical protein
MKVIGLNGRTYAWRLASNVRLADDTRQSSSLHKQVKELLSKLFPLEQICEEVYLPGSDGLTADFVIPTRKLIVEAQGEQHYHFIGRFYQTKLDFIEACKRDKRKREWAELNQLTLVELKYDGTDEEWRSAITSTS